jgi:hypothetical protein
MDGAVTELTRERVLWALSMHKGASAGVHVDALVREICGETNAGLERDLRHIVEDLRDQGHHICAHPRTGYFIAATAEELEATLKFLRARAMASLKKEAAMRHVSLPELLGQLRLPT